jgi:flagellar motor switch/type III secretory pathway protein FliN
VTVELVRFNKLLADLISLQLGHEIELDNDLDEPFDLFANGKK